ncbi:hypothetical protein HC031_14090 [Planosporangium thailandense]|uniref:DUF2637 domain-containing protein n=1 Tax=Planosporangium thailandense TaxID=765197 RepID=A0ABX0Y074_9ACTN|nr:hypothetical protein [Planosporangium thailandense]NJC70838.1 hypothetical protein [Planosporangium thailandense]
MSARRAGEPRLAAAGSWAVLAASFGLSAATWVAIGRAAGFDGGDYVAATNPHRPLSDPGLSWALPVAVDGYLVVALVLWMAPVPQRVARFARTNTYVAAAVGIVAQSAYHALSVGQAMPAQSWRAWLAGAVGALPPALAALAVHMRALLVRESTTPDPVSASRTDTAAADTHTAVAPAAIEPLTVEAAEPWTPIRDPWEYAQPTGANEPSPAGADEPADTPARTRRPGDEELLARLAELPRRSDGTVPVRRAMDALGISQGRAYRLLDLAGLRTSKSNATRTDTPAPVNGSAVPADLAPTTDGAP